MIARASGVTELRSRALSEGRQLNHFSTEIVLHYREDAHRMAFRLLRVWGVTVDHGEIRSHADLALCEAALRYKPNQGSKFTTYLFFFIKGVLARALGKQRRVRSYETSDFDTIQGGEWRSHGAGGVVDPIDDTLEGNPERLINFIELKRECYGAVMRLNPLERTVIAHSVVNDSKVAPMARMLGYSRGHISEVKGRALKKLKTALNDFRFAA